MASLFYLSHPGEMTDTVQASGSSPAKGIFNREELLGSVEGRQGGKLEVTNDVKIVGHDGGKAE